MSTGTAVAVIIAGFMAFYWLGYITGFLIGRGSR